MVESSHHAVTDVPRALEQQELVGGRLGGPPAFTVDGLVLLAGLFTAITPWVVDDFAGAPRLVIHNLVLGLAVAVIGLVLTAVPTRGYFLSWVLVPMGVWEIITPWVIGPRPNPILWTNVVMGAVITVLGVAAAGLLVSAAASLRRSQ
ncbi:SPW repeat protein [Nocardia transvalensis]|uniref:SPW repeat protein n=1 Tax=Nocardia transvalensis TaxID=37333 RepID=UPI0018944493|nr:SPW repeat protein [Nocardia transvalensis]MBF6327820.1 SPW repeat protein [Nocardia transvalensis]